MQSTAMRFLKAYLWFIAAFHLFVGLATNLSPSLTQLVADWYGAQVDWTPQFVYILKPLGAFMLVLGGLAVVAARDPLRNSAIVVGFMALFLIRAAQRLVFSGEIAAFSIVSSRNMINMAIFVAQAVLLYVLWNSARKTATP